MDGLAKQNLFLATDAFVRGLEFEGYPPQLINECLKEYSEIFEELRAHGSPRL